MHTHIIVNRRVTGYSCPVGVVIIAIHYNNMNLFQCNKLNESVAKGNTIDAEYTEGVDQYMREEVQRMIGTMSTAHLHLLVCIIKTVFLRLFIWFNPQSPSVLHVPGKHFACGRHGSIGQVFINRQGGWIT